MIIARNKLMKDCIVCIFQGQRLMVFQLIYENVYNILFSFVSYVIFRRTLEILKRQKCCKNRSAVTWDLGVMFSFQLQTH